jgi:5-methylcytosine-specific restriction endonuclease McrA
MKRHSNEPKLVLLDVLGGECDRCGNKKGLQIDHIWPVSEGGPNKLPNLQLLCSRCHKLKTKREFRSRALKKRTRNVTFRPFGWMKDFGIGGAWIKA